MKLIKVEQQELFPVKRDYSKISRELPEQKSLYDLPLFNLEYQKIEQLDLFKQAVEGWCPRHHDPTSGGA